MVLQISVHVCFSSLNSLSTNNAYCMFYSLASIGCSGSSENTYLSCPWRASTSAVVKIIWLFSPDLSTPARVLDIDSDPKLSLSMFSLVISNISSEYEGVYYCKVQYSDGSESSARGAGCAFVAGEITFVISVAHSPFYQCFV